MDTASELELVEKCKENINAFDALYDHYFALIYAYCLNRLSNKELAQDVTSKVFLSAVEQISNYDTSKGVKFGSWLYRVAHNKIIDAYRHNSKRYRISDSDKIVEDTDSRDMIDLVNVDYLRKQIAVVLKELNPRYQMVITLKFYSELGNSEIAEIMEVKVPQVAVIMHRAIKDFKQKYQKKFPNSEIF